jgi:PAS domain S-box-containing protein
LTPEAEGPKEWQERLHVLTMENELLAERAEEITLLGLVAEQIAKESDPQALLAGVLERVCILKAIPFGACLVPSSKALIPQAFYHARRMEGLGGDQFMMVGQGVWPLPKALVLGPDELAGFFTTFTVADPGLVISAVLLVPLTCRTHEGSCLLMVDDLRTPGDLGRLLPLLERVADLVQVRLDNLALLEELQKTNQGLSLDVVERTEALQRSEARFRTLFECVPDGVLLVDAEEDGGFGGIEDANEVAARMHGYSLAELKTMDYEALSAIGSEPPMESFEERVWNLQPGETVREELLHRRKDGSTFPVEAIGTLVRLQGKQYILAFSRDMSERNQARDALFSVQRTESVGLLAGGIAHDFNNLLTAIMGQTNLVLEQLPAHHEGRDHLEKALNAAAKASVLTQQMLAYSGRGRFTIEPLQLNQLIEENLGFLEAALPKQVRFDLDLDEGIPMLTADHGQIQQVIMNLVLNGVEAIGNSPGIITLRTRAVWLDDASTGLGVVRGGHLPPGHYLRLDISDTGCGMSPETLARVFDPFFTTKAHGHGLGLSAVQGIIQGHRGSLAVDSDLGKGTTFHILLPVSHQAAPGRAAEPAQPAPSRARTVLVVDDEDYMLEVVQDSLEAYGHRALLAQSGEQALELLRREGARLHMILLDLTMPGMDGIETFREIRKLDESIPVVLSSGFAVEEATSQLNGLDLAGFLQKPYMAKDLIRVLEGVTAGRP